MTIREIQTNEALRNREFPVTQNRVFMAHAAVCSLPRCASDAMRDYLRKANLGDQEEVLPAGWIGNLRRNAASLLGVEPAEIALVGPTSLALSFIAGGLAFEPGDQVVVYQDDYPSNVYPWLALKAKGVEVRHVQPRELGRIELEEVEAAVSDRTRLVTLASCHFVSGRRIDVDGIGAFLRERGILFCVDAIQTIGAFPTPTAHVDFLAADAHKWMLGPCAAGIMFVRRESQSLLQPTTFGWHNIRCPGFVAQEDMVFRNDARRYEAGTANLVGLAGLNASLEMLMDVGIDNIAADLQRKRAFLVRALQKKGFDVLEPDLSPERASGIVTFLNPEVNMAQLHQSLVDRQIITSLRLDRKGRQFIRLSPHFYNTDAEMERFLESV